MKIKLTLMLITGIIALNLTSVNAQTSTPPSESSIKAAEEMLIAASISTQLEKSVAAIVAQFGTKLPQDKRAKFIEVMTGFMNKYCSWEALKHDLCIIYAREFTEDEMKQLTVFYKSPIGTKFTQKQTLLLQAGMNLGQQATSAHQAELQQLLSDAMK